MDFENIERFQPKTCISGKVRRLQRLTSNIFRKHLKPYSITESQLSMLFVLSKAGSKSQKELVDFMMLEKSSVNRNLKRLMERNYVTKANFPKISMTREGLDFTNKLIPVWEEAMNEISLVLQEDGISSLNIVLNKFD